MLTLDQPQLFIVPPICTMEEILTEVAALIRADAEILRLIEADLDAVAEKRKEERLANAEWKRQKRLGGHLPGLTVAPSTKKPVRLATQGGRPRTPPAIVLAGLFVRGRYGSLTAADVRDRLKDSAAFSALLWRYGMENLDATVLARHVNNLSDATVDRVFRIQLAAFKQEGLDDFELFSADSTSVRANAQWPNDSSLIYKLLRRGVSTLLDFSDKKKWCRLKTRLLERWLEQLRTTARDIDLQSGKPKAAEIRKVLYGQLFVTARKLAHRLGTQWDHVSKAVENVDLRPTDHRLRQIAIDDFLRCVSDALTLIDYSEVRIQQDPDAKRDEHEKITGITERDAEIIKKGGREPNFGFKIQTALSGNGVVTALIIEKGNVSDSESLIPLLNAATERTGVKPKVGTVDDGYSSKANWRVAVEVRGMDVLSISGAKGRKAIGDELYDSDPYREARRIRGKLEFPFFCLKHTHEMDRMKRTGLVAVRREITEKAIAYNAVRLVQLRKQKAAAESQAA